MISFISAHAVVWWRASNQHVQQAFVPSLEEDWDTFDVRKISQRQCEQPSPTATKELKVKVLAVRPACQNGRVSCLCPAGIHSEFKVSGISDHLPFSLPPAIWPHHSWPSYLWRERPAHSPSVLHLPSYSFDLQTELSSAQRHGGMCTIPESSRYNSGQSLTQWYQQADIERCSWIVCCLQL